MSQSKPDQAHYSKITENNNKKLWGGRFSESTDEFVEAFTASINFDQRLYKQDIIGSKAHASMLGKIGVLKDSEVHAIQQGLTDIEHEIQSGKMDWQVSLEDVHMNIEAALTQRIGDTGKKLHTGRSRNDQIATDIRLWLREHIQLIQQQIRQLQENLLNLAEKEAHTIMPGFTHLQVAQPITFGHHLLAWFEMLQRDHERLQDCYKRVNIMPLGAAALAGTTYPIDRQYCAELLDFDRPAHNSLDAVSDRDFAIEFSAAASILMMHLSRFAEEMVIWTSAQFNFIQLPDRFCTGSSIMPQKKNPDVPELVRGKTGRVYGHLISLLTLMKSQPLAYNKDNQEDKEPLFDTVDTVMGSVRAFTDMIPHLVANRDVMRKAAIQGYSTATDLADYLVRKGIPFRDAHEIVGEAVSLGIQTQRDLSEISLPELQALSTTITQDVFNVLTLEGSVSGRNHWGGTAPEQVLYQVEQARNKFSKN